MCFGLSGGGCKMVICWNVNKSMDDLEHHSQLVFSMSGLQGFPHKTLLVFLYLFIMYLAAHLCTISSS